MESCRTKVAFPIFSKFIVEQVKAQKNFFSEGKKDYQTADSYITSAKHQGEKRGPWPPLPPKKFTHPHVHCCYIRCPHNSSSFFFFSKSNPKKYSNNLILYPKKPTISIEEQKKYAGT